MGEIRALRSAPGRKLLVPDPGPQCGWTEDETTSRCRKPRSAHYPPRGHRLPWGHHLVQCQVPNPEPDPSRLDGYPLCCLATGHQSPCCYLRHIALTPAPWG